MVSFEDYYLNEWGNAAGNFARPRSGPDIISIGKANGAMPGAGGFKGAAQIGVPDDITIVINKTELLKRKKKKNKDKSNVSPKILDAQAQTSTDPTINRPMINWT
jgi:hypothetical protein